MLYPIIRRIINNFHTHLPTSKDPSGRAFYEIRTNLSFQQSKQCSSYLTFTLNLNSSSPHHIVLLYVHINFKYTYIIYLTVTPLNFILHFRGSRFTSFQLFQKAVIHPFILKECSQVNLACKNNRILLLPTFIYVDCDFP